MLKSTGTSTFAYALVSTSVWLVLLTLCRPADADSHGTLTGTIFFDGELPERQLLVRKGDPDVKDAEVCASQDIADESLLVNPGSRGIANVFVYLRRSGDIASGNQSPASTQRDRIVDVRMAGCRFMPHALIVRTDQRVRLTNNDSVYHAPHPFFVFNSPSCISPDPGSLKGTIQAPFTSAERFPAAVKDDIYPWMSAYWLILDHPFAALTNADGEFTISDIPSGEQNFVIWHERAGIINSQLMVHIKSKQTTNLGQLAIPAGTFKR